MFTQIQKILWITVAATIPLTLFADWSGDTQSVDSVKHWKMDDRVVCVKGKITRLDGKTGFYLSDDTGEILVRFDNKKLEDHHFKTDMRVEVKGRVDRDHKHHDLKAQAVKLDDGTIIGNH